MSGNCGSDFDSEVVDVRAGSAIADDSCEIKSSVKRDPSSPASFSSASDVFSEFSANDNRVDDFDFKNNNGSYSKADEFQRAGSVITTTTTITTGDSDSTSSPGQSTHKQLQQQQQQKNQPSQEHQQQQKQILSSVQVVLNVYDLDESNTRYWYAMGLGYYHSGVQLGNSEEFAYGAGKGIVSHRPRKKLGAQFRESYRMGEFSGSRKQLWRVLLELRELFRPQDYNLIFRNCNSFSAELVRRLTGAEIPHFVNRMATIGRLVQCLLPARMIQDDPTNISSSNNNSNNSNSSSQQPQKQQFREITTDATATTDDSTTAAAAIVDKSEAAAAAADHEKSTTDDANPTDAIETAAVAEPPLLLLEQTSSKKHKRSRKHSTTTSTTSAANRSSKSSSGKHSSNGVLLDPSQRTRVV